MTTYKESFDAYLKERITAGGEVDRVIALVNAFQGTDPAERSREFGLWLDETSHDCDRCGIAFFRTSGTHGEDDEVVCSWCNLGRLGLSLAAEPMPGWAMTWRR